MALLQYYCKTCKMEFEEFAKPKDEVNCPKCKGRAIRSYSGAVFTNIGKSLKKCSGNCKNCSGC